MSDTFNPQNSESNGHQSEQSQSRQERARRFFDDIGSAVRKGADDARRAAQDAIPKVKTAAADAAYWTAYGLSFATVFEWTVLKQIAPECVKSGCSEGVKAGQQAAENWMNRMRQPKNQTAATPEPQTGPAGETLQPGTV